MNHSIQEEASLKYDTNTPILFMVFNRPELSRQIFARIKKAQPQRLYIAADGPRTAEEKFKCDETRAIISEIDWDCQLKTLFRDENLGCGGAISQAVSWFFEQEAEGIVLEDDCLPADSFFGFCSSLLEKYRHDERIGHISGGNYQKGIIRGDGSYYFSAFTHVWGWAGWRRVWKEYDIDLESLPLFESLNYLEKMPVHGPFRGYWLRNFRFNYQRGKRAGTWDFQYAYLNLINNRLSVIPNVNLITNIGCSIDNTPTHYVINHPFADIPLDELTELKHPSFVVNDIAADLHSQAIEINQPLSPQISNGFLFLKEQLLKKNRQPQKIPHIIHQIYEDPSGPPDYLLEVASTWKEYHPHWEYRFWNKQAIDEFLESEFPDYISAYYAFSLPVLRWDAIRCLILYHYGGLYADMDYECFEPLDVLLGDSTCCLGMEPYENALFHSKDMIIGNALMASVPRHDFFKVVIDEIFGKQKPVSNIGLKVMENTGPFMITRIYKHYQKKENITLLPAELIAPLTVDEAWKVIQGQGTKSIEEKVEKAFAFHYFLGSWVPQLEEID